MRSRFPVLIAVAGLMVTLAASVSSAQSIDDRLWGSNGTVNALARSGSDLFLGGSFNGVRPQPPIGWARWDMNTSEVLPPLPRTDYQIDDVEPDGMGGWYIAGQFTKVGGLDRRSIARILSDGTVASFKVPIRLGASPAPADQVRLQGGTLYIRGYFDNVGGVPRPGVCAVNANTGALLPWSPTLPDKPWGMELGPGKVYLAGSSPTGFYPFLFAYVKAVDAVTGANTSPTFPSFHMYGNSSCTVDVMKRVGNTLYVAGLFDTVGTTPRRRAAAVDLTTGAVLPWNPNLGGINLRLLVIEADASHVYCGGYTTNPPIQVGKFNPFLDARDATTGAPFGFVVPNYDTTTVGGHVIKTLHLDGSSLYMNSAEFAGGPGMYHVMKLDALTGAYTPIFSLAGLVYDMEIAGSTVMAVGNQWDGINETPAYNLAAFDIGTGGPAGQTFPADPISQMVMIGSTIFTIQPDAVRAYDAVNGGLIQDLSTAGPGHALASDGLHLYVAGEWDDDGTPRGYVTRFDPVALTEDWTRDDFDGPVTTLAAANGRVYVGGDFFNVGGFPRARGAALDPAGTVDPDWNYGWATPPSVIAADASGVYMSFGAEVQRYDIEFGYDTYWTPTVDGEVRAIALSASRVYLGGAFNNVNFNPKQKVAAVNKSDAQNASWNVGADGNVNAILLDGTDVYLGGEFHYITVAPPAAARAGQPNLVAAQSATLSIVRITEQPLTTGVPGSTSVAASALQLAPPFPNPARTAARVKFTLPFAGSVRLDLFDVRGRHVRELMPEQMLPAGPHETSMALEGLGAGLYFTRLSGTGGSAVQRISVMP